MEPAREHWTGEVVGRMHEYDIGLAALAERMDLHPDYLGRILNGKVAPKGAEEKVKAALAEMTSPENGGAE